MRGILKQTYPCVDIFVSGRIQKALDNRIEKGTLVVRDVQDVCKIPFGLSDRPSATQEGLVTCKQTLSS